MAAVIPQAMVGTAAGLLARIKPHGPQPRAAGAGLDGEKADQAIMDAARW